MSCSRAARRVHDVLHLLGSSDHSGASFVRIVAALVRDLDRTRYRHHAWFLGTPGPLAAELIEAGVQVRQVRWNSSAPDVRGAVRFLIAAQKQRFSIVHQHFGGRAPRILARLNGRPAVVVHVHSHCREDASPSRPIHIEGVEQVVAVSRAVSRCITGSPVVVIPPGVALPPLSAERRRNVIGTAARLAPVKGLSTLLLSLAALRPEFPDVRLEIAGTGPLSDQLKTQTAQLGLEDSVTFLGWDPMLAARMQTWTLFALPSLCEGLPIAALEAMAAGLPVIASDVGGVPEAVDASTGILIPPSDPEAMTSALRSLLEDRERSLSLGTNGRERVRTKFSQVEMTTRIAAIYESMLHGSS